jgi:alkylated DNA nucleotide flippase Atl1
MAKTKSPIEWLNEEKTPKIVEKIPEGAPGSKAHPDGSMVVSTPQEINGIMRRVPEGKLITLDEIRSFLAKKHGTTIACPVSTAIFINVCARASVEMQHNGETDVTPYWRTLKTGGILNEKYPGGAEAQAAKLEVEGFTVVRGKKGFMVADYKNFLATL